MGVLSELDDLRETGYRGDNTVNIYTSHSRSLVFWAYVALCLIPACLLIEAIRIHTSLMTVGH